MNPLYLTEDDVRRLVTVPEAIACLRASFVDQANGRAFTNPRQRLRMPDGSLHLMSAAVPGYFGFKAYTVAGGRTQFLFFLYESGSAELAALMQADSLGQIRTGAASGLATDLLALPDAAEAAIFGAGWQAESQLTAIDAVRSLKKVWIVGRRPERIEAFIGRMQPRVRAELARADSAEAAVKASAVVTTITSSKEAVLRGEWLQPGQHINAAGANALLRRELDDSAILRANRIVVDSIDQSRIESGEFLAAIETGRRHWEDFCELRDLAAGLKPGRTTPADITLFKSAGIALEDVALGRLVYERAVQQKAGRPLNP